MTDDEQPTVPDWYRAYLEAKSPDPFEQDPVYLAAKARAIHEFYVKGLQAPQTTDG